MCTRKKRSAKGAIRKLRPNLRRQGPEESREFRLRFLAFQCPRVQRRAGLGVVDRDVKDRRMASLHPRRLLPDRSAQESRRRLIWKLLGAGPMRAQEDVLSFADRLDSRFCYRAIAVGASTSFTRIWSTRDGDVHRPAIAELQSAVAAKLNVFVRRHRGHAQVGFVASPYRRPSPKPGPSQCLLAEKAHCSRPSCSAA